MKRRTLFRYRPGRSLLRCRSGATAVEAAFIFPVLIVTLLGIIEASFALFAQHMLHGASYSTARNISVSAITITQAESHARAQLPQWLRQHLTVQVTQTTPENPSTNAISVRLQVPVAKAAPFSLMIAGKGSLSATATARQEISL
jgi:Flp pilus assembly protein TadG